MDTVTVPAGFTLIQKAGGSRPASDKGVFLTVSKSAIAISGDERVEPLIDQAFYASAAEDGRIAILPDATGQFKWTRRDKTSGRNKAPGLLRIMRAGTYTGELDGNGWWIFHPRIIEDNHGGDHREIEAPADQLDSAAD